MEIWKKMWVGVFFLNTVYIVRCQWFLFLLHPMTAAHFETHQVQNTLDIDVLVGVEVVEIEWRVLQLPDTASSHPTVTQPNVTVLNDQYSLKKHIHATHTTVIKHTSSVLMTDQIFRASRLVSLIMNIHYSNRLCMNGVCSYQSL